MSVGPMTVARVAFPNRVTSWTEPEAYALVHADLSSPSNAQAEGPIHATDKNRTSAHILDGVIECVGSLTCGDALRGPASEVPATVMIIGVYAASTFHSNTRRIAHLPE